MNTKYSSYIKLDGNYINNIMSIVQNIVAEVLFNIDFENKKTTIYNVSSNSEGLGLKLYVVLKDVTYVNEDERKNISFIIDTLAFLEKIKTFTKSNMIMITADEVSNFVYLKSMPTLFIEYKNKEANISYNISNTCEKLQSPLNHKFDTSEYPISDDPKYYAQFIIYDLNTLYSFMKNPDPGSMIKMQFDTNSTTLYINNTDNSPACEIMAQRSNIDSRIMKTVSLSNIQKLCGLKKISKHVSIKVHKVYPNRKNYTSEKDKEDNINNKIYDIDSLVIHPLKTSLNYDITFIINCNSLN
jgi:hypothetical protein